MNEILGYLFEGHLTVDMEPPQPQWLVQTNLLNAAATLLASESSSRAAAENEDASQSAANLIQSLIQNVDDLLIPVVPYHFFFLVTNGLVCTASVLV